MPELYGPPDAPPDPAGFLAPVQAEAKRRRRARWHAAIGAAAVLTAAGTGLSLADTVVAGPDGPQPHQTVTPPRPSRGSPSPAPTRVLTSTTWAVTISVPSSSSPTPYAGFGRLAYDGASGWMQVQAAGPGLHTNLRTECTVAATGNVLHPFGSHPRIVYRSIGGRAGCLILPSADAVQSPVRARGPKFQTSEALVMYTHPLPGPWNLLVIYADPAHLIALVNSVRLLR